MPLFSTNITMDNVVLIPSNKISLNMGATSNFNGVPLVILQERKKSIEEALTKKEKELKQLCLQEAELTGIIPSEMPLQPGESLPSIRRKVGTLYSLSESLLKPSNKDENVFDLELQLQLHANMAEAALGLAHKQNLSKTVRKQHKTEYQHHKQQYKAIQEKIALLKEIQLSQSIQEQTTPDQQKQRKKPRPVELDDDVSIKSNEPCQKEEHRQSLRSSRQSITTSNTGEIYPQFETRRLDRSLEIPFNTSDDLSSSFYKLNLSGYECYLERRGNYGAVWPTYSHGQPYYQHHKESSVRQHPSHHYNHFSYNSLPQSSSTGSPISQPIPTTQTDLCTSSDVSGFSFNSKYNPRYYQTATIPHHSRLHSKTSPYHTAPSLPVQSSPQLNITPNKFQYTNSVSSQNIVLKNQNSDPLYNTIANPHQLQPHQQYEQNSGLGGYWRRKENGEIAWCNSANINESSWRRDKRCGSLDRRKNRKMKRMSPESDRRSATLTKIPFTSEQKTLSVGHSSQVQTSHSQDRQLVRTQSLGSVGVQTSDSAWRSDDNSSCGSDNQERSRNSIRRSKQKEWRETFLDGPELPSLSVMERCQSTVPLMLAPEEKYIRYPSATSPTTPILPFEIPAESNPHPRMPDANLELLNNNIPKNCTVVQAGHCKPYHEETKPFEMSDFYKYSTKFKKSPSKTSANPQVKSNLEGSKIMRQNLNEYFDNENVFLHSPHSTQSLAKEVSSRQLDKAEAEMLTNLQDPFIPDMWYNSQSHGEKKNNNATLV